MTDVRDGLGTEHNTVNSEKAGSCLTFWLSTRFVLLFFETRSYYVAQVVLKLVILLPQPSDARIIEMTVFDSHRKSMQTFLQVHAKAASLILSHFFLYLQSTRKPLNGSHR